jgi:CheY-like chemotaxis protein
MGGLIQIGIDVAADAWSAMIDPTQLELAILNLAINARDAMPVGGLLSVQVANATVRHAGETDRPTDLPPADYVIIRITDTGIGMEAPVLRRVFEPFFTTKEAGRGTGLGLSTVYGFVKQSKGAIAIATRPGAGTTVTLFLPQLGDAAVPAVEEEDIEQTIPSGLRVMLVEDDPEVRKVVQTFLRTLGCSVVAASNAEQALMSLETDADPFDLLLSDIALGPGMRGTRLAAEAQQRFPELAILLMSGFSSELLEADREVPQSWELLRKPYTRAELARAMARVLAHP